MTIPRSAAVVVISGGGVGRGTLYHRARRGQRDVVVLEHDSVGSGTSKAAGPDAE